jgi:glycogen(starch) synthase
MVLSPPTERPTALWVVPVSDIAGVARHVLDTVRVGIPGWRLVVLCPPGPLADAIRGAGGAVLSAPFGPTHGLRASVSSLRHAIRGLRPQVVHSHLSYADVVVALATPRSASLVTTEHGISADDGVYHSSAAQARLMAKAHAARLRRFDQVIAVSEATAGAMRKKWHARQPIRVVPNGVDAPTGVADPRPGLRLLSLARLAPEKRLEDLLGAFALVAQRDPDARLTIAGIGPLEGDLRAQVGRLGLASHVAFVGFVEAHHALGEADVVAQLSVWENCSYTLLDAVTHGLGVVASPVGGNSEILPERCLADPSDHQGVAERLVAQGRDLSVRPRLNQGWPSIAEMGELIGSAYRDMSLCGK